MTKAVCSGSFDPVTNGHIDIFERAGKMFDELIVCVFNNLNKKPFFSIEERLRLIEESTKHIKNLRVAAFSGLLVNYMHKEDAYIKTKDYEIILCAVCVRSVIWSMNNKQRR